MNRFLAWIGGSALLVSAIGFAALNGGQRVTLRLGFTTLYRVPLSTVAFGALILGMLVMLATGVTADLRVRRILRDRLAEEDRDERDRIFVDRAQTNLFDETGTASDMEARDADP